MAGRLRRFILVFCFLVPIAALAQEKPDALALYRQQKYAEAEKVCLAELEETPKRLDSYVVLVWALLAQKKYEDAARYTEKALKISRYDKRNIYSAVEAYYYLGDNDKALKYCEEYVSIAVADKNISIIYNYMGEIFIRLGEFNNADIAFSTALHYDNKQADWWARLGYAREMGKNYRAALEAYENALKLNQDHSEAKRGKKSVEQKLAE
ncbi:MAG: tetratricopeptide repeat protein [Spirochaetales bacterium]|nr:tetratricopeptide repeat protein [Spirochaetales bacterium]